jgi:hypothetical protein
LWNAPQYEGCITWGWTKDIYHEMSFRYFTYVLTKRIIYFRTRTPQKLRVPTLSLTELAESFRSTVYVKNTNHQQMHKESFIINCNTLLHVSTLLGHLQGEYFITVTLRLHFIVEWECAVDFVLRCFWRREVSAVRAWTASSGPDSGEFTPPVHSQQHILTQL